MANQHREERPAPDRGVYGISVAAELSGVPAQSLRLWERHGLLTPARSDGGTRRYSTDDLARLQRITVLVAAGVNIAGISRILNLEDDNTALRATHTSAPPTPHRSNAHSPPVRPHRPAPGAVRRGGQPHLCRNPWERNPVYRDPRIRSGRGDSCRSGRISNGAYRRSGAPAEGSVIPATVHADTSESRMRSESCSTMVPAT